jgi:hypothetical protein
VTLKSKLTARSFVLFALILIAAIGLNAQAAPHSSAKTWEYGPFVNGGVGIGDRSDYKFMWTGAQAGRTLTPVLHAGPLTGSFELGVDAAFFQAYTPAAHSVMVGDAIYNIGGGTFTGATIAPVIFRWNFSKHAHVQPWFQAKGAVLYTTHKFPPDVLVAHGDPGGTSVWNFMPQGGVGFRYFTRPNRSIDFGLNAIHISSASLGDKNPGVNASLQFQVGYTFWK